MSDVMSAAPVSVKEALTRLKDELARVAGVNFAGLILYGGLARGRFRPGRSDVNVLLVLHDASGPALDALAPALHDAWRMAGVEPMILTLPEVRRAAEAFPTKFYDIKNHHVVLAGSDPFIGLEVSKKAILRRAGQELHNLLMRLRRRYISIARDPARLTQTLEETARPFAIELASLLVALDKEVPADDRTLAIYDQAAAEFGLNGEVLGALAEIRQGDELPSDPAAVYRDVLDAVAKATQVAERMSEGSP